MDHFPEEEVKRVDSASDASSLGGAISSSMRGPGYYRGAAVGGSPPSSWFEIRLFYVRISPCAAAAAPPHLTLAHLRREIGVALEINGARVPAAEPTSVVLRRDRVDRGAAEVTYVTTDSVRLTGSVDFEVRDGDALLLCGALERVETPWGSGVVHHYPAPQSAVKDPKTGWSMDCYSAASLASAAFVQPKLGITSPSIEVYVAGCCSGFPLILTQTVQHSPRRKTLRQGALDVIPEDDETGGKDHGSSEGGLIRRRSSLVTEGETDEDDTEVKVGHAFYTNGGFYDDDGQLSWFNAGVRVGVGIGLGMCLGIGIGVGLLMRSYQATTRTFRRRFL